jgi:hypothetical protein
MKRISDFGAGPNPSQPYRATSAIIADEAAAVKSLNPIGMTASGS